MEPVKLAMRPLPTEVADRSHSASRSARIELDDAPRLRFGDDLVYLGQERHWAGLTAAASRAGVALREHPGLIDRARLHVIIQKGRLFQREHPDVGVLVDKGRYLLVDMARAWPGTSRKRRSPAIPFVHWLRSTQPVNPVRTGSSSRPAAAALIGQLPAPWIRRCGVVRRQQPLQSAV